MHLAFMVLTVDLVGINESSKMTKYLQQQKAALNDLVDFDPT